MRAALYAAAAALDYFLQLNIFAETVKFFCCNIQSLIFLLALGLCSSDCFLGVFLAVTAEEPGSVCCTSDGDLLHGPQQIYCLLGPSANLVQGSNLQPNL